MLVYEGQLKGSGPSPPLGFWEGKRVTITLTHLVWGCLSEGTMESLCKRNPTNPVPHTHG